MGRTGWQACSSQTFFFRRSSLRLFGAPAVSARRGISRSAVERRVKALAVQITKAVGVEGLQAEGAAFVQRLRARRDAILASLERFDPERRGSRRAARVLTVEEVRLGALRVRSRSSRPSHDLALYHLLFATGMAAGRGQPSVASAQDRELASFDAALHDLLRDLAIQVAKDGEGLSKFVTIEIGGAESWEAARRIGLACANSPILKAAIFGEDPNWGRVVMAIGKSGEAADRDKLSIWFGPHQVARNGERAPDYIEHAVADYMKGREIVIRAEVGVGSATATVWTCDLTHDYISINADYRS